MECLLFNNLAEEEREEALSLFEPAVKLKKGDELYKNGWLGVVTSGSAKIKRKNDLGNQVTVRNLSVGEVFGCVSVFGSWQEGFSSIIADTECTCRYISEENLKALLLKIPAIALNYITFLSDRIRFLNRRLDTFSTDSSEQRIYEFLLSSADESGTATLSVGMAELSRRLKMGRTSLYRGLSSLESSGLIKREGSVFHLK